MFDKLKFWKKEDEFDFDNLADKELQTSQKPDPLGLEKSPFNQSPFTQQPKMPDLQQHGSGDVQQLELINSKLDTIKAMLNTMEQRLARLEQSKAPEPPQQKLW
ncbi:hypothetical protein HOI26_00750 [Candidatus Woesearchaeota archaeon]|jgi:hypothetical protein|nr:hypothetical protein [Candidatus Woesearchaeota archaeon]MBT5739603.1 hypothetical protein [Candidatus Woesearchaeota archaeon]